MFLAGAIRKGRLVPEKAWQAHVRELRQECDAMSFFRTRQAARKAIAESIITAIEHRAKDAKKFGLLLSGGVDSSFLALLLKQLGFKFVCFSVGVRGSRDLAAAKVAARKLKLKLFLKEYGLADAENVIKEAARIVATANPVTVGIAATEVAALKLAKMHGVSVVFTGLGSEEIFAGYQRHVVAKDISEECWSGLAGMWTRDFLRDAAVASKFKATALTPFLDRDVIVAAMRTRPEWKIAKGEKKLILREVAAAVGLPVEIAFRPKMAAQYGSGFDKAMGKLAKQDGFGNKRRYLSELL